MHKGLSQLPETPEFRQKQWDISSNSEREMYTNAMEQWKKDYPFCAGIMADCIGDPAKR